ncbi:hypothetical protein ABZT43_40500 [Streptomyces sp. NPDC005349]|uniref:hypothetical protein n=1 Tax=Streptomyces sp. NPDC005349 TaxID=3157037 RepID=UPI0033BA5842
MQEGGDVRASGKLRVGGLGIDPRTYDLVVVKLGYLERPGVDGERVGREGRRAACLMLARANCSFVPPGLTITVVPAWMPDTCRLLRRASCVLASASSSVHASAQFITLGRIWDSAKNAPLSSTSARTRTRGVPGSGTGRSGGRMTRMTHLHAPFGP